MSIGPMPAGPATTGASVEPLVETDRICPVALLSARGQEPFTGLIDELGHEDIAVTFCRTPDDVRGWMRTAGGAALLCDVDFAEWAGCGMDRQIGRLLADFAHLRVVALAARNVPVTPALRNFVQNGWLHDFHSLPFDRSRLAQCLRHIQGLAALETCFESGPQAKTGYGEIIGVSNAMRDIHDMVRRVARVRIPVLLTGESGTGKELIARTIHDHSPMRTGKFVAINCAALPPNLIESELFGHEAGAFTGAGRRKRGRIEDAHEGTLFLDEIGDMPVEMQPHFLRFLQGGVFMRVGGTEELRVRTRVIAATNADLGRGMQEARFRDDLYYRLNGVSIEVPPLRVRGGDITLLARHYLRHFSSEYDRPRMEFSQAALIAMANHRWPGNVRELMSAVGRAVALAPRTTIRPEDLGLVPRAADAVAVQTLAAAREAFDRSMIAQC
ncbi:MAG: sigma-54 dependent transcriptional regulator, partial [Sphingomonadales bacterium]